MSCARCEAGSVSRPRDNHSGAAEPSLGTREAPPSFPLVATISGVPVVTIPLDDYRALLMCHDRLAAVRRQAIPFGASSRSPIETDSVISTFFIERFGTMRMEKIVDECRRSFGKKRTPSRTAAYAYWKRLRARAAGPLGPSEGAVPD